ncbi:PAS domain S-box protein, partial [Candidatus Sumerlaeota bacterium]|nr:PAS domain S-box protein [Candidatus Sumerlaeota bacterium]
MSGGSPPQAGGKGDAIFDNSLDAILIIDGETGNIVRQNRACLQILGYESGSLIGKQLSILFPPDAEQGDTELVQRVRIHGAVIDSQNFLKADGTVCPMELTATIIPWEESHAIMATFRDVSERKTAEAKINEQFHRLSALRKIDMAIAGTMDVRLILNVILDQVITELGVDACSVLLLNPKLHTLTFHSGRGFHT